MPLDSFARGAGNAGDTRVFFFWRTVFFFFSFFCFFFFPYLFQCIFFSGHHSHLFRLHLWPTSASSSPRLPSHKWHRNLSAQLSFSTCKIWFKENTVPIVMATVGKGRRRSPCPSISPLMSTPPHHVLPPSPPPPVSPLPLCLHTIVGHVVLFTMERGRRMWAEQWGAPERGTPISSATGERDNKNQAPPPVRGTPSSTASERDTCCPCVSLSRSRRPRSPCLWAHCPCASSWP